MSWGDVLDSFTLLEITQLWCHFKRCGIVGIGKRVSVFNEYYLHIMAVIVEVIKAITYIVCSFLHFQILNAHCGKQCYT